VIDGGDELPAIASLFFAARKRMIAARTSHIVR